MKFIFILIFNLFSLQINAEMDLEKNKDFLAEIKLLKSIPDEDFYTELEKVNQQYWEFYVKNYAKIHNLSPLDFPKAIPSEISLRIKGVPISELKKMLDDPKKNLENTNKQYKDLLDGIRKKTWITFSEQKWMESQSGYKKPVDQKEIEAQIEAQPTERIDLKIEEDSFAFFKQPWVIILGVFLLFILATVIFKLGK